MVLYDAELHGHLQETPHHDYVGVVGWSQRHTQMLVNLLNTLHQDLEELLISNELENNNTHRPLNCSKTNNVQCNHYGCTYVRT